jgi:hypothetical protein
MLMFQPDYVGRLIEMGEADAESRAQELAEFMEPLLQPGPGESSRRRAQGVSPAISAAAES